MRLELPPDADLAALVRGVAGGGSLVLVIAAGRDPVRAAATRAMLAPLAVELAPATRLNAVLPAPGAAPARVDAAVAFLEGAASTTGQWLEVSAGPAPARATTAGARTDPARR